MCINIQTSLCSAVISAAILLCYCRKLFDSRSEFSGSWGERPPFHWLTPRASLSRLSSPVTIRPLLAPVNIQRCRWVWAKWRKPSTVDCTPWLCFVSLNLREGERQRRKQQNSESVRRRWDWLLCLCYKYIREIRLTIWENCISPCKIVAEKAQM